MLRILRHGLRSVFVPWKRLQIASASRARQKLPAPCCRALSDTLFRLVVDCKAGLGVTQPVRVRLLRAGQLAREALSAHLALVSNLSS